MAGSPSTLAAGGSSPTIAGLLWPARRGQAAARALVLILLGSCLLTLSAKVQVPGPVPMTLQTLAVMVLGAALGWRLALASVAAYVVQGAFGWPVFANTPPLAAGPAYLLGPTGGFLLGFAAAAVVVGLAADRGLARRPLTFALVLAGANLLLLAVGWLWLAFLATTASGVTGVGLARAFELGVQPFLLGNALKVALAAVALPVTFDAVARFKAR